MGPQVTSMLAKGLSAWDWGPPWCLVSFPRCSDGAFQAWSPCGQARCLEAEQEGCHLSQRFTGKEDALGWGRGSRQDALGLMSDSWGDRRGSGSPTQMRAVSRPTCESLCFRNHCFLFSSFGLLRSYAVEMFYLVSPQGLSFKTHFFSLWNILGQVSHSVSLVVPS